MSVLRKLNIYNEHNELMSELIRLTWTKVDDQIRDGAGTIKAVVETARATLVQCLHSIIDRNIVRYASEERLQPFWAAGLRTADRTFTDWLGRRHQVFMSAGKQSEYDTDVIAACIESGGLPHSGVFSPDLMAAMSSLG